MRIFVFEYVTGGGMLDTGLTSSLVREGDLMLRALVSDLCALDGVDCLITRDARLAPLPLTVDCRSVATVRQFSEVWEGVLNSVDAVWPIVPEYKDALGRVSDAVLSAGKILLNSGPAAVRMAASKLQTLCALESAGIPVVPTFGLGDVLPDIKGAWVMKPDDGVGCLGIRVHRDRDALCRAWDCLDEDCIYIAQPFLQGTSASLSLLVKDGEACLLSVNRQRVALMDDGIVLLGCVVNGLDARDRRFHSLASSVAAALPGLWGYVGVDLIINSDGLWVLEINPRLTTSYVGLKDALGINPAGLVLGLHSGERPTKREAYDGRAVEICLEYAGVT
jgi:tyramine---L-glutamate ligase